MSMEYFVIKQSDLDFGDSHTEAAKSTGLVGNDYIMEVDASRPDVVKFEITPNISPLNDSQVNSLLRGPILEGETGVMGVIDSMTRLVNKQSIVSQKIKNQDPEVFDRLQQASPNIHTILDILEGGEMMEWQSTKVRVHNSTFIDNLEKATNEVIQSQLQVLPNRVLFALLDDPDSTQFPKKRFKRVSANNQVELLSNHLSRLSDEQRTNLVNRYRGSVLFETTVAGRKIFIERENVTRDLFDPKVIEIELMPKIEDDGDTLVTEHMAYFRTKDLRVYGQPVISWKRFSNGSRTFTIDPPIEQPIEKPLEIIFTDSLLGAIALANIVGLEPRTKVNNNEKSENPTTATYARYNSIKSHSSPLFVAGLMPYLVLTKQDQILGSDFISQFENIL